MKYKTLYATISLLCAATSFAGGVETAPHPSFSGLYVGFGSGLSSLYVKDSFVTSRASGQGGASDTNKYTYTSILYAGQLGYGHEFSNRFYLGLEGSIAYAPLQHTDETGFSTAVSAVPLVISGDNTIHTTSYPTYALDGIFGYAVCKRTLPFFEIGLSWGKLKRDYSIKRTRSNLATPTAVGYEASLSNGKYQTQFNVGIGARRLIGKHVVASSLLTYTRLGENSASTSVAIPGVADTETHSRTQKSYALSFLGSISYLFNF